MKYLIVGLGNPGSQYAETRHNIGFKTVEELAQQLGAPFKTDRLGDVAYAKYKGRVLVLLKPSTYMNLSGKAVNYWMQQEKIGLDHVLIITDDLALPYGKLRLKGKGSDGGHNGLKDIFATLKTDAYARLRFGVGSSFAKGNQVDYVLGEWDAEERQVLAERLEHTTECVKSFVSIGIERTMNFWNKG
jgi:peptidyl-tRNA hydrolase, PTH1 family